MIFLIIISFLPNIKLQVKDNFDLINNNRLVTLDIVASANRILDKWLHRKKDWLYIKK